MWGIRVLAYCLLSNHYHLLVQTPRALNQLSRGPVFNPPQMGGRGLTKKFPFNAPISSKRYLTPLSTIILILYVKTVGSISSCNVVFLFILIHTRFLLEINKIKPKKQRLPPHDPHKPKHPSRYFLARF